MKAYIKSTAILSPQKTFGIQGFPEEITDYRDVSFLKCIEPVYKDFLDPMVSRRMSRVVKMGVCTALNCLRNAGVDLPDAIIAGTGLGCIGDTEKFLGSIYEHDEHLLNPTPFINSTHNTVAGAIALALKCHGYNATYTHRGFSFESAIMDSLMAVAENPGAHILTGGFDELTTNSYAITKRLGLWKSHPVNSLALIGEPGRGTLPGEGLAFFLLSGTQGRNDLAKLISVKTFYRPKDENQVNAEMTRFIREAGLSLQDIDLAILGLNGDRITDHYYRHLMQGLLSSVPVAGFKHLCGEYDTASSFAVWMASEIIRSQQVPVYIRVGENKPDKLNHVLIYNHLRGHNHALYLLSSC